MKGSMNESTDPFACFLKSAAYQLKILDSVTVPVLRSICIPFTVLFLWGAMDKG